MTLIKGLILCEGLSDQALIGSYLSHTQDWTYTKKFSKAPFPGEPITWYSNSENEKLGIWAVGGNDFTAVIHKIMGLEIQEHSIGTLAIVTDHDDEEAETKRLEDIWAAIEDIAPILNRDKVFSRDALNNWVNIDYVAGFKECVSVRFCYLLVPMKKQGALETFMLQALSENDEPRKDAIRQAKEFVSNFSSKVYLTKRREKTKAELSVSISVICPDKMFETLIELINSVDWNDFSIADEQFRVLQDI